MTSTPYNHVRISADGRIGVKFSDANLVADYTNQFLHAHAVPTTKKALRSEEGRNKFYGACSVAGAPAEIAWSWLKQPELTEQEVCEQWLQNSIDNPWARLDDSELGVELKSTASWENYLSFFPNVMASASKIRQLESTKHILWSYNQGLVTQRLFTECLGINKHGHRVYPMEVRPDPDKEIGSPAWVVFTDWLEPASMLPVGWDYKQYVLKTGTSNSVKFKHDGKEGQWDFTERAVEMPILRDLLKIKEVDDV